MALALLQLELTTMFELIQERPNERENRVIVAETVYSNIIICTMREFNISLWKLLVDLQYTMILRHGQKQKDHLLYSCEPLPS